MYAWSPLIHADELFYLRAMDKAVSDTRAPYRGRKGYPELQVPRYALISSILPSAYPRTRGAAERASAQIAGSRILLALHAYKDRYARYPDSLDVLRAGLGWEIPEDPFSGKDLVYQREGNGFLLYSIGEDLKDDDARLYPCPFTYEAGPETGHFYKTPDGKWTDDIIWRMDH